MKKDRYTTTAVVSPASFRSSLVIFLLLAANSFLFGQMSLPDTIAWGTAASQPFTVSEAQGKVVKGKLYTFGGFDSQKSTFTPTKRSYVYDPVQNIWTAIADLPFTPNGTNYGGVTHTGITTDGTNIFLASGYTSNDAGTGQIFGTEQVWRYNVATNTYTALPNLPAKLSAGQMEFLNGKLHYIGGTNSARTEDLGTHYVLDLNNLGGGWKTLAPVPNPRHHAGSAVVGGKIYYIGGQHDHDSELMAQKEVDAYDPNTNTWTRVADLPVPSGAMGRGHISSSSVVLNGRILVFGGETVHNKTTTNMVSMYDPATNLWTNLTPMPANRFSGVAGVIDGYVYYTTGSKSSTTYKGLPFRKSNYLVLGTIADAHIHNGTFSKTNYGGDSVMLVKTNTTTTTGYTRSTYLKFTTTSNEILAAKLRIYGRNTETTTSMPLVVAPVANDSWSETAINWDNAPAHGVSSLGIIRVNNVAKYYELDVTEYVQSQLAANDKILSFSIRDTAKVNKFAGFNSKEHAENQPQLVLISATDAAPSSKSITFSHPTQSIELQQGAVQSLYDYIATSDANPVNTTLQAIDNNGTVPSWLTVNDKMLNGINYTSGSEISFDFKTSNLAVGNYTAKVTSSAPGYNSATLDIFLSVTASSSGGNTVLKVNFQNATTTPPTGWLADFGEPFGPRSSANQGTGNTYGWLKIADNTPLDLTANGRARTTPSDILLRTFMHMQGNSATGNFTDTKIEGIWEAKVANGNYDVTVSVGDANYTNSTHYLNIEGVPAIIAFTPTSGSLFKSATISVSVTDGLLTVDARGGINTKINYISIQPATSKRPSVVRISPENSAQNISENTSISTSILNLPNGGIDNSTITSATVFLKEESSGTLIPANVNGTGGGDAITLVPQSKLKLNTVYTFTITDGVKDLKQESFIPFSSTFQTTSVATGEITTVKFEKVQLPNTSGRHSSLTKGPDGKLYALTIDGIIKRFPINIDGTLGTPQLLYALQDAYGARTQRLAIGLTFDPASTSSNLIAYITHSTFKFLDGPDMDGKLTRLSGADLQNVQDILVNLPRSSKDHLTNSIAFGPDGALYFTQGSVSAMGEADKTWNMRKEPLLSAAVLRLDTKALGSSLPLNVLTPERGGSYSPYNAGAPLTIYASGVRNAYDLVWHSNGQLYVPTNGSAAGGNTPTSVNGTLRPDGTTYNDAPITGLTNVQQTQKDLLFRIEKGGYYGHPNPSRGEYVMNGGNPSSVIDPAQVDAYPVGTMPDKNWRGYAFDFQNNKSPNGAIEYRSNTFNGALKGKLMVVRYSQHDDIITLTPSGINNDISEYQEGNAIQGFSGFVDPLDLTEDTITGSIYVSEYGGNGYITLLRPLSSAIVNSGKINVFPRAVYDNDVVDATAGTPRVVTVKNTAATPLSVTKIEISGAQASQFTLGSVPSMPVNLAAGDSIRFTVSYKASAVGLQTAFVTIENTDTTNPVVKVALRGLGTPGVGGTNEPSLQALFNLYQLKIGVGDDNVGTSVINSSTTLQKAALMGDEIAMQQFTKAGSGPVTIEPLAVFGPSQNNPVLGMGWYPSGNIASRQELFTVGNSPASNAQTVNVSANGKLSFDPGTGEFGFYSNWPFFSNRHLYSEDNLNTFSGSAPHHVRVYPYRDSTGTVANTFVVAFEEHITGLDYQDLVFVVRNIKPIGVPSDVVVSPIADAFVRHGSYSKLNYGSDTALVVKTIPDKTGFNRYTYLKFPLSGVSGNITKAKLRLYGVNIENRGNTRVFLFGAENDGWAEQTITYQNAPVRGQLLASTVVGNEAKYYEWDVADFVKGEAVGDKTITLVLEDTLGQNKMLSFRSKEHPSLRPELVVSTGVTTPRNAMLFVENLDKFPSNDVFVNSRLQVPWTRDTQAPFVYNANHDTARVRIHNKGMMPLVVTEINLSDTANWELVKLKGTAYDASAMLPLTINPSSSTDLLVHFKAKDVSSDKVKIVFDTLTLVTNDDNYPVKRLNMNGLWQRAGEGSREPTAQIMINAFGYTTTVGFSGSDPDQGLASKPKGDEILSSYFVKADASKPVHVRQMGAYHGCCRQTETIRWYPKGTDSLKSLIVHAAVDAQSLLPRKGFPNALGENTFNPTTAFGFKVGTYDWTDTLKTPKRKIGIRIWKAYDANGHIIPNSYIIANDYLNTSVTNYDYNDNMYLVSNVRPELGTAYTSLLASTPSSVDFGEKVLQTSSSLSVNLKNLGQTYNNGSSDPSIYISSVVIRGENGTEFKATLPAKTTLAPQESTTLNVSFNPASQGLKIADMLVYYNSAGAPYRIPLYGIGKASNAVVTATHRIRGGSSTPITVNGKTWSADLAYAYDNLEPFANNIPIAATDEDVLYQREQSSNGDKKPFRYEIPLSNGDYHVRLHFAEIYWGVPGGSVTGGAGSRVMNLTIENQLRLANLDIAFEAGVGSTLVKNFPVTVTDGKLNINFGATVNRPMVSAVEVYKISVAAPATQQRDVANLPIEEVAAVDVPKVYPNPVKTGFRVALPKRYTGEVTLQLSNGIGASYNLGKYTVTTDNSTLNVDVSKYRLKPGVYYLTVASDKAGTAVVKLVVQ